MKKLITLRCEEKTEIKYVEVKQGIYNGFGEMFHLPLTYEIETELIGFDTKELGNMFIEMGNMIKKETSNITDITLLSNFYDNPAKQGKMFSVVFSYETSKIITDDDLNKQGVVTYQNGKFYRNGKEITREEAVK